MKIIDKTDETVTIEMTHEKSWMIVALVRKTCFGTPMFDFTTRVGHTPKEVGKIGTELNDILCEVGIE